MNLNLHNKIAFVTGGSHGIGRSIVLSLANEGCKVAFCGRKQERVNEVVERVAKKTGNLVYGVVGDLTVDKYLNSSIKIIANKLGGLHILVNNVGGGGRWGSENIEETEQEVWDEVYNKNVVVSTRLILDAIPIMRKQKWGRVITVTSIYGKEAGGRPWFNVAKCAQTALMKNLSLNKGFARDGITFNSVAPGAIMVPDTGWEKMKKEDPQGFKKTLNEYPYGRLGEPREVADVVTFLSSEKASYVSGASILVDGGQSRCI